MTDAKKRCPCRRTACPQNGRCKECRAFHQQSKRFPLPACAQRGTKPAGVHTPEQAERGADYRAFSLFSATHWAELLGAAAVIFLCAVIYYRCREVTRHQILRAVFVLMLADEFMKQAVLLYTGQWNVTYLPLHLCSINIFVCWYDAIHQSRWSKEILYALCIPGAVVAMLSPSWQRLPVWNLLHLHSYSIHVLLILYPVLLLAGGFRPQVHHIRWVLAFLCAIATPIFFLNRLLKTNFFFLNDPQGNAITAFFAHCFGERFYLLGFLPVLAAVLLLLYLPDRKSVV